jgi:hypothetical protein
VKVNEDGRCIPALKREVLAPFTAVHKALNTRARPDVTIIHSGVYFFR